MRSKEPMCVQEQLLRAGIAPRYAKRLALEWQSHLDCLTDAGIALGQSSQEAREGARRQLGTPEALVAKALEQPSLKAWGTRWPLLICGVAPALGVCVSFVFILLLVDGSVKIDHFFYPGQVLLPRGRSPVLAGWVAVLLWLGLYGAPLVWALATVRYAGSRRLSPFIPIVGVALSTALGAMTNMQIEWPRPGHLGQLGAGIGFGTNPANLKAFATRWVPMVALALAMYFLMDRRMQTEPAAKPKR
jgi:hypothetical protein